jgi:hypothetical protein
MTDTALLRASEPEVPGTSKIIFANGHVVGMQSRLYSPGYGGPARWVLFDPESRRAFSALGKDVVPDAIELLALAVGGVPRQELVRQCAGTSAAQIDGLIAAGLLSDEPAAGDLRTMVETFHTANVDYPFFDYGSDNVVKVESDLLDRYAALWESPPAIADREGPRYALPAVDVGFPVGEPTGFPSPRGLAVVLRTLLGPIGEIRTRHAACLRRTTPSGGARHPTEAVWVCRRGMDDAPAGAFTYDPRAHCLVREPPGTEEAYLQHLGAAEFGFVIRSRVARAMWRYRDLRALRPLVIDAGHVAEMLSFLLGKAGVVTDVVSPPVAACRSAWLHEPEMALVVPVAEGKAAGSPTRDLAAASGWAQSPNALDDRGVSTNPALVLRFDSAMAAEIVWPTRARLDIDQTDFLILNHCLPSTRGDRDGSPSAISDAVPGATEGRVKALAAAGALLPADEATDMYRDLKLWVRHDWYTSSLALLDALADGKTRPCASRLMADASYIDDPSVLLKRRTTRVFHRAPISIDVLNALLRTALGEQVAGLTTTVAAHHVDGLEPGLYRSEEGGLLRPVSGPVDRDRVATATAGQSAAAGGAVTVWLSLVTDPYHPAGYLRDLLDLGRLGQRLCEVATSLGLGVFLTPAAYDRKTCTLLGLHDAERLLTYVFAVGHPAERTQS